MSRKLLAGAAVLGAGILAVVFGPMAQPRLLEVRSVSALLAHPIRALPLRLDGSLVKGSLCKEAASCGYRFALRDTYGSAGSLALQASPSPLLSVRYPGCLLSDCMFDTSNVEINVTVLGKLGASAKELEASQIYSESPEVCRWLIAVGDAQPMAPSDVPQCAAR